MGTGPDQVSHIILCRCAGIDDTILQAVSAICNVISYWFPPAGRHADWSFEQV